jgi:anti-sigma regulatory factor (Ser/Thr protein kinase)
MLFAIQLCLEEAVANVIMYGAAKDDRLEIVLFAHMEDVGRPFDRTQVLPPTVATSLKEAKVGDFGIHLVGSFASRIERRDDPNRLTLRFVEAQATSRQPR